MWHGVRFELRLYKQRHSIQLTPALSTSTISRHVLCRLLQTPGHVPTASISSNAACIQSLISKAAALR